MADEARDHTDAPASLLVSLPDFSLFLLPAGLLVTGILSIVDGGAAPVATLPV